MLTGENNIVNLIENLPLIEKVSLDDEAEEYYICIMFMILEMFLEIRK